MASITVNTGQVRDSSSSAGSATQGLCDFRQALSLSGLQFPLLYKRGVEAAQLYGPSHRARDNI